MNTSTIDDNNTVDCMTQEEEGTVVDEQRHNTTA